MKALRGVKRHPVQWIVFSGLSYLFIGSIVGLFFHEGPLVHTGNQFADIPLWLNVILLVLCLSIGAHGCNKEAKASQSR